MRVQEAETAIKLQDEDMSEAEHTGLTTTEPGGGLGGLVALVPSIG